jgi:hypothetical protein
MLALRPGDPLMRQGEASDAAYIIIDGSASIRIETGYGNVDAVNQLWPNQHGSPPEVLEPRRRQLSVTYRVLNVFVAQVRL